MKTAESKQLAQRRPCDKLDVGKKNNIVLRKNVPNIVLTMYTNSKSKTIHLSSVTFSH